MNTRDKTTEAKILELQKEVTFLKKAIFVLAFIVGGLLVKVIELSIV